MKLILAPLSVMFVLILVSQFGLGPEHSFGEGQLSVDSPESGFYYDSSGSPKINATTLQPVDSSESITVVDDGYTGLAMFYNDTQLLHTYYPLYYDMSADNPVFYRDFGAIPSGSSFVVDIGTSFGFLAVIVGVVALASVVGITVFGSGESEYSVSVIVLFTGALAFWTILSLGGFPIIVSIPLLGPVIYVVFTFMYSVGCFQLLSNGGSE